MHKNRNYKSGFTLIELAVVLIIISLMLGFLVAGRDLMRSAENSSVIADITYYSTARKQFEKTYGYLPGDVPVAYLNDTKAFGDPGVATNFAAQTCGFTTGIGKWGVLGVPASMVIQDLAWLQLSYTKMIEQNISFDPCAIAAGTPRLPGVHRPFAKFSNQAGVTFLEWVRIVAPDASLHQFIKILRIGKPDATGSDTALADGVLSVKALREIDRKLDKPETPTSGRFFAVRSGTGSGGIGPSGLPDQNACAVTDISTGSSVYPPDSDKELCTANFADLDLGNHSWIP